MRIIEVLAALVAALGVLAMLCMLLFMGTFGLAIANTWLIETTSLHLFP